MNTHDSTTQDQKHQSSAGVESAHLNSSESNSQFVDNRPVAVAQRNLQQMVSESVQMKGVVQMQVAADDFSSSQQYSIQRKIKDLGPTESWKTANDQPVIQRGIHYVHEDKNADENDLLIAKLLAKDIEGIVEAAAERVDDGEGMTDSSAAYYRDKGTKAAAAKRGTAIHFEAYDIIGKQIDGYGVKEKKCQVSNGRMDIVIKLPSGNVIVYDITSCKQAEQAHAGARGYEKEPGVIAVIEISYDDDKV